MSTRSPAATAVGAVVLVALGFALGAGGSALQTRYRRTEPWRKILVDHEGTSGTSTRTRLLFENPKLPLQAIEVRRSPEGMPEVAHVALRDGSELTVRYAARGKGGRPSSVEGADGSRAELTFTGSKVRVRFTAPNGADAGERAFTVPAELRRPLEVARAAASDPSTGWRVAERVGRLLVGEACAQEPEDDVVTVVRDVSVQLDVRAVGEAPPGPNRADLEASCAPLSCVPATPDVAMPGAARVHVRVTGSSKRSALRPPGGSAVLGPFEQEATKERETANRVLPDVAGAVAAVSVVASGCKSLKVAWPICVSDLLKPTTSAAGAIHAIGAYEVGADRAIVAQRAEQLYYESQARAALDQPLSIRLCASRSGYARACTTIDGRPFAPSPMAPVARSVELRRGIGGTLEGSFIMTQSDGADCKFSPSPQTEGPLRIAFDNQKNTATATLKANARGTRPNLRCSLGSANMTWSQSYNATLPQSFTAAELQSGGKLALRMPGTMNGSGGYTFSNCRSSGGASANCPGGKNEGYSYRIELTGEIDLTTQTGSGRIVVFDAPLATSGTWRIPAEGQR